MLQNNLFARENYLFFADSNYLAARSLLLNNFRIPGIAIAEQAAEQYLKLKIYELFDEKTIKELKIEDKHILVEIFKIIEPTMKENNLTLKPLKHYQGLLEVLYKAYKFRYFDEKGVMGELNKGKIVTLGFTDENFDKFDEMCCELRNSVFVKGQGACPVNLAFKDKEFFRKSNASTAALHQKNKQYGNFKARGTSLVDLFKLS